MADAAFERQFRQILKRVDKRLKAYLADPSNEENIHFVRTSLRKLDAIFPLLPKKLRKRNRSKIAKYRTFHKLNSKVRDCDIIRIRIAALGTSAPDALQIEKKSELAKAVRLGLALKKLSPIQVTDIAEDKLSSRTEEIVRKLTRRISDLLPIVLSSESKVEELHKVRKDCKKLRYILEMVPKRSRQKFEKIVANAINTSALEELQDILGTIHDSDITLEYLRRAESEKLGQLLAKEIENRKKLYEEFVERMKKQ